MLPSFLDIQTMIVILWIVIGFSIVTGMLMIKNGEKPMLRVSVIILISILMVASYNYIMLLKDCEKNNTKCSFYSLEVPQDDGFVD